MPTTRTWLKYFHHAHQGEILQPGFSVFFERGHYNNSVLVGLMFYTGSHRRWWTRHAWSYGPWHLKVGMSWTVFCNTW